jgi:hypothetical protein
MSNVRALLTRVAKLEQARATPKTPFELAFGSFEAFEDKVNADLLAKKMDRVDGPLLLNAVRKWHRDHVWQGFQYHRNGTPQYANR